MAVVRWLGKQTRRPQVTKALVGSTTVGHTFTLTIAGKAVTYVAVTGDTLVTIAAGLAAAAAASVEGEFSELTVTTDGVSAVYATGPDDGAPFTLTGSGTGTLTMSTPTAALSPHDVGDTVNWSGGALPTNADVATFDEPTAAAALYRLTALTAVTCGVVRRATYPGPIGLPDTSAVGGYPEYRPRRFETAGTSWQVEQDSTDGPGQVRLNSSAGGAVTVVVTAAGGGRTSVEAVDLAGLPAGSAVTAVGAGVTVSPAGSTASTLASVTTADSRLTLGEAVAAAGAVVVVGGTAVVRCPYTSFSSDRDAAVGFAGLAAGTSTTIDGGTATWQAVGSPGLLVIGTGAAVDFSRAPGPVTVTDPVTVSETGGLSDPAARIVRPYELVLDRTQLGAVTLDLGTHFKMTVDDV